jgi:hypothetical protein
MVALYARSVLSTPVSVRIYEKDAFDSTYSKDVVRRRNACNPEALLSKNEENF